MATKTLTKLNAEIAKLQKELEDREALAKSENELAQLREARARTAESDTDASDGDLDDVVASDPVDDDVAIEDSVEDDVESQLESFGPRIRLLATQLVPRTRRSIALAALAATVLAGGGVAVGVLASGPSALPAGVAFSVYGHNVSTSALSAEVQTLGALYGIQAPTGAAALARFQRNAAKAYAVSLILDHAAGGHHIVIADKQASDVLTRYISQQFGDASDATSRFVMALGDVGTNEKAVLTEIKRQLAIGQLFDDVTKGVSITDAQLAAEFTKDKAGLATPAQRDIRNIVVSTSAEATDLLRQLVSGASFSTLASKYSLDASTRASGGDLGKVAASQLDAGYAKVAFAAKQGEVFGPVQTQYGWNVGLVVSESPAAPAVFAQVKSDLKQQMELTRELVLWRSWLGNQIRAAHVHYASKYRPSDPDAAPSGQPGQPTIAGASTAAAPASAASTPATK